MSVYISLAGEFLAVPDEDDLASHLLCDQDCRICQAAGTNACPVRMRRFERLADDWMLQTVTSYGVDKKAEAA